MDTTRNPVLILKFKVSGNLRFLSHAETLRLFHRACARACLDVAYSSGFNPRPKISLPLPRSVGLACEDETCLLQLNRPADVPDVKYLCHKLADQMPDGIDLIDAELLQPDISLCSGTAIYELTLKGAHFGGKLQERVCKLLASDSLKLTRRRDTAAQTTTVDVRRFLESIEVHNLTVVVRAGFSPQGSVRVDEILTLLGLDADCLDGPVTRTRVLWDSLSGAQRHN